MWKKILNVVLSALLGAKEQGLFERNGLERKPPPRNPLKRG